MSEKVRFARYPNRKYYCYMEGGYYTNSSEIANFIRRGKSIVVIDHRTKKDITLEILTNILFLEERKLLKPFSQSSLEAALSQKEGLLSPAIEGLVRSDTNG